MNLEAYWDQGISFENYLNETREKAEQSTENLSGTDLNYHEYYKLGNQRMTRVLARFKKDGDLQERLDKINTEGKILIISEGWCGDASHSIPVTYLFFSEKYPVRIVYRDQHPELIENFLTNGAKAIPIIIFLDKEGNYIFHWGPRPKHGKDLLEKHKADPENFTKENFYKELQTYYSKNRGKDILNEIMNLLEK